MTKPLTLLVNIDHTLCATGGETKGYLDVAPQPRVVKQLRRYHEAGYHIILFTSRQMSTYAGNLGKVSRYGAGATTKWLTRHRVPYDELLFGRPWMARQVSDIDGRTLGPDDFLRHSPAELAAMTRPEQPVSS